MVGASFGNEAEIMSGLFGCTFCQLSGASRYMPGRSCHCFRTVPAILRNDEQVAILAVANELADGLQTQNF
jgi:hypothetical protein